MKTTNNNQNIESKNGASQVINYNFEIVRDFDGSYYANVSDADGDQFRGLPEYVTYSELKKAVKEAIGVTLPALRSLGFTKIGRKHFANAYGLEGVRVKQPAMAFHLQDKVILGADMLGESRPHAVGCIVTSYKWSVKAGEFMYQLQGEDGKQYWDFERNIIPDPDGGRKATLESEQEITDIPAADLVWDEDNEGVKVWGNIESHRDNLERMGGRRGRVVFTNNKTGLPTGADCYTFTKDREADIREYVSKTHDRISRDFSETRDKHGERGHEYHEGERVVTVYGRGTVVKTDCWHATDLIDVRLDAPTYNYIWSLAGTPQRRVAVNRDNIVSIELPEPPKEVTFFDGQSGKAEREDSGEITSEPTL